jgi:hypothetical protein
MSLPRSHSHNAPTNPRNKPQTIPKRKHDSKSKRLSCPTNHQADRLRPPGKPSASSGGLSEKQSRTSSTAPSITDRRDGPADRLPHHEPSSTLVRTVCELRATKIHRQNGSNETHARTREEDDEHLGYQAPRGPPATPVRTVHQEKSCSLSLTS